MSTVPPTLPCSEGSAAAYSAPPPTPKEPPLSSPGTPDAVPPEVERVPKGIRWSRIVGVVVLIALGVGGYRLNQWRKTSALRAEILEAYDRAVAAYRRPLRRVDERIASRVLSAASAEWEGDMHDPIFRVDKLRQGNGLYVRVPRKAAARPETLRRAARKQHSDAVGGCLAVNPALYGRLLVLGEIVAPDFREKILEADNVTRLRALDQDFVLRAQRDLPRLAELLRPDWLIAVLEGGPARIEVHIWDLHSGRELLRVRPQLESDTVNVRWSGRGAVPSKLPPDPTVLNTVRDCAIASAIRDRSGETLTTVGGPLAP